MSFKNRLLQIMSDKQLRQVDVLKLTQKYEKDLNVSISKTNLSNYVNGKNEPDNRRLMLLAKALNVNESWLMGYDVPKDRKDIQLVNTVENLIVNAYKKLNEENRYKLLIYAEKLNEKQYEVYDDNLNDGYNGSYTLLLNESSVSYNAIPNIEREGAEIEIQSKLSAGTGTLDLDPEKTETIYYSGKVPSNYDLAFEVSGNSMTPTFENGEIVFIKRQLTPINGAIMALTIDGEAFLKKVYVEPDKLRLVSLNPAYDDIIANELNDVNIIGKVVF